MKTERGFILKSDNNRAQSSLFNSLEICKYSLFNINMAQTNLKSDAWDIYNQATKTFEYLKNISFNKAFSSSMNRPYETAQIILQNSKDLKIEKIDSLVEISHGLWEGKLEAEIREQWPALLKNWHDKPKRLSQNSCG